MSTWVQTSKYGDILSALPMIHQSHIFSGKKQQVVTVQPYDKLFSDIDYAQAQVFGGSMHDLAGAIKFAKQNDSDVKVTQLHGRGFEFQHRHPSFQYDQWDRAGMLHQWDKLPLELPRKKYIGQFENDLDGRPFIVFADHSQSSPFPHKEGLATLLSESFPSHQIVRLSSIQAPLLLDILALMDAADLIVTVETAHLHLSKACRKPVIALVTDKPSRWHGSAWSSRFSMHCRYSDFLRRKEELIRIAKNAIDGKPPISSMVGEFKNKHGYNLGMLWHGDCLFTTHRYHPEKDWRTRLAINDGLTTSDIRFPSHLDGCSFEDARLFHHNGKLMMTYVVSSEVGNQFRSCVGYGELIKDDSGWSIKDHMQPEYRNNNMTEMVKNWCPFEHDGKVHFIWGNVSGQQSIIEVDGARVVKEYLNPEPVWGYGTIRGGAIISYQGKMLRFFHSRTGDSLTGQHGSFQYHIGAMLMEAEPPFKTISVSVYPILSGDERYVPGCFHWKPNCVLPYGAIFKQSIQVSIGRNDSSCEILNLQHSDLNL